MPVDDRSYDVIVVDAGASGGWAARELAPDHDVILLEPGEVGGGASGHPAGFVSAFDDWAPYPAAVKRAIDSFRALDPFALSRFESVPSDFQVHGTREMPSEFPGGRR